jgi:hypothetical protein
MNYEALPGMEEALRLVQEKKMSKEAHKKAAKAGKRWQDSDGDGKWYEPGEDVKEAKKDDTYLETDMKKRQANNEKARKELAKGPQMKNPHFEEVQLEGVRDTDPEKGTEERKARLEKKRGMKLDDHPQYKKEEVELDENRAAARAAGGYKDDSKKQTDPSKAGFTGISGSIKDIMRQNKEIEAANKAKAKKEEVELEEGKNKEGKEQGVDGKACWKGYRYAGTENGKDKCVPANEELETMEASLLESGLFSDDEVRYIIGEKFDELEELYKGKHGQSEKEYQDGRSDGGKMVSGDSKHSGAAYSSRAVKNSGPNPAGGSKKPQGQGRMTSGARADLQYRKANMKAGK